jgi:hypothetical protein
MPRFDGTGPQSQGPMTGRGEGYCAIELPQLGATTQGYAGIQGRPVRLNRWLGPVTRLGGAFRRGRGRGAARGRGRRSRRW